MSITHFKPAVFVLALAVSFGAFAIPAHATTYTTSQLSSYSVVWGPGGEIYECSTDVNGNKGTVLSFDNGVPPELPTTDDQAAANGWPPPATQYFPPGFFDTPTHFCFEEGEKWVNNSTDTVYWEDWVQYPGTYIANTNQITDQTSALDTGTGIVPSNHKNVASNTSWYITPPTATLTANPTTITSGSSSTLTWGSTNATSCTGTNFSTGSSNATSGTVSVSPTANKTYTVTCVGLAGTANATASVTITVTSGAPTATLTANPTSITSGNSSALTWGSTNATSCTGTNFSTGNATSGTVSVSPTANTTYTVTCTGAGGSATASATVTVTPPPPFDPTATLTANPSTINSGESSALTWGSTGALSCTGTNFSTGNATSGTVSVSPSATQSYTVTCSNSTGASAQATAWVTVTNGPSVSLVANPTVVNTGQSSTLTWTSSNVTSCTGTNFSTGATSPVSGSKNVTPAQTTTYTVSCTGPNGPAQSSATVTVNAMPPGQNQTCELVASPSTVTQGDSVTLYWSTTGTGASINNGVGTVTPTRGGSISVIPSQTTTYTLTCTGVGYNNSTVAVTSVVTVNPSANLSALLTASPDTVYRGSSSLLSWSSTGATSCSGSGFSTGNATNGSVSVTPLQTTGYQLTCVNGANNAYSSATVTVKLPDLSITATPNLLRTGDSTTVSWSVTGQVDSCTVIGPGLSSTAVSGSQSVAITAESTYTMTCLAGATPIVKSVTVKIVPSFQEI